MISADLEIDQDMLLKAQGALYALGGRSEEEGLRHLNPVLARAARDTFRDNLQDLNASTQNVYGAPKSNYYGNAAKGTSFHVEQDGFTISIAQVGIGLHYFGGTVEAGKGISFATGQPTKYLTIPACAEAYGHSASDFAGQLEIAWGRKGPYALVIKEEIVPAVKGASKRYNKALGEKAAVAGVFGGQVIMYWLVEHATIGANENVLPTDEELNDGLQTAVDQYVEALASQGGWIETFVP
jgi:hypothetical protein